MKLGKHQINKLSFITVSSAQITGCSVTRSLAKRGLMRALGDDGDSWYIVTPEGLEALASELRAGRCEKQFTMEKVKVSRAIPNSEVK